MKRIVTASLASAATGPLLLYLFETLPSTAITGFTSSSLPSMLLSTVFFLLGGVDYTLRGLLYTLPAILLIVVPLHRLFRIREATGAASYALLGSLAGLVLLAVCIACNIGASLSLPPASEPDLYTVAAWIGFVLGPLSGLLFWTIEVR